MLKPACLFADDLKKKYMAAMYEEENRYYSGSSYTDHSLKIHDTTWEKQQFVSVNEDGDILGYLSLSIDRECNFVSSIQAIRFSPSNFIFQRDFRSFLENVFEKTTYTKIKFSVFVGNTIEKMYDKYINKYNGRIVGILKNDAILADGTFCDRKIYELTREEYELSKLKSK